LIIASLWQAEAENEVTYAMGEGIKIDFLERTPSTRQSPLAVHSRSSTELLKAAVQQPSY